MLRLVGIPDPEHRVDHYPHQFSGGQKQRIVIAQALVLDPGLIIADEPTTALDVTVQAEILDLLRRLPQEFGSAIVLITHNMGVVADLADRVAVMYNGEIVEQADVRTLFASPQHPYTRKLLDAVPRVGGRRLRDRVRVADELEADGRSTSRRRRSSRRRTCAIVYPGRLRQPAFTAVDGVDLVIRPGEVLGLVGESGSGKTTIGRAIAGLTPISGGSLQGPRRRDARRQGEDVPAGPQAHRVRVPGPGDQLQPAADDRRSAWPSRWWCTDWRRTRRRPGPKVDELLEAVQLPKAFGDRFPHELSGGQRQRASLARALILGPELLIADEPTSALDVSVQARVLDLFARLQAELGFACLFISHDLAVVDLLAHRIAVLHRGVLVEEGTGDEVLGAPKHPYTQRLLASLPVPDPVEQAARREAWRNLRAHG